MTDYISREAAIDAVFVAIADGRAIFPALNNLPAADVRPVVRGEWIDEPIKGIRYHCSVCQGRFDYTWHFCPNCGAKMRSANCTETTTADEEREVLNVRDWLKNGSKREEN